MITFSNGRGDTIISRFYANMDSKAIMYGLGLYTVCNESDVFYLVFIPWDYLIAFGIAIWKFYDPHNIRI